MALAATAAAAFLWFRSRPAKPQSSREEQSTEAQTSDVSPEGQVQNIFLEARKCLKKSPLLGAKSLEDLPIFLLLGPSGVGKTSALERSGLDRQLLAGQIYSSAGIVPTRTMNVSLARGTVFVELNEPCALNQKAFSAVMKHISPGRVSSISGKYQPARGIILCVDPAVIAAAKTPDELASLARPWNECLSRTGAELGTGLPVYVLFTRLDKMESFADFFSELGKNELAQIPGCTIQPFNPSSQLAYAEEMAKVLGREFSKIVFSLYDSRVPLLSRLQSRQKIPIAYQFPRDLQKLQKNLTDFLVELSRPSQLHVSPFLRGFYLSGIRKIIVERSEEQIGEPIVSESVGATSLFEPSRMLAQHPISGQTASDQVSEWPFLPALFERVLLQDKAAHKVTSTTTRTDRLRAYALAATAVFAFVLCIALTVSYAQNRRLERDLLNGARSLKSGEPADLSVRLESLREPLQRLIAYNSDPPLSMRWGLYSGHRLFTPAAAAYCQGIRSIALKPIIPHIISRLQNLDKSTDSPADFRYLKAYMMATVRPDKADPEVVSTLLTAVWGDSVARLSQGEVDRMAAQFNMYGKLLSMGNLRHACPITPLENLIPSAQAHLRRLNANDHYQSLLLQAGRDSNHKQIEAISYERLFPNGEVKDPRVIPGWYTHQGWENMQNSLKNPKAS